MERDAALFHSPSNGDQATPVSAGSLSVAELLWQHAFEVDNQISQLQGEYDQLVTILSVPLLPSERSFDGRNARQNQEQRYSVLDETLNALKDQQIRVLSVIEDREAGITSDDEALEAVLPRGDDSRAELNGFRTSKRRQAIAREKVIKPSDSGANMYIDPWYRDGGLVSDMVGLQGLVLAADARRITTGRDRTKYVAQTPQDADTAVEDFMYYTADTHGGKSRHNGKAGSHYISASGKRIRKC